MIFLVKHGMGPWAQPASHDVDTIVAINSQNVCRIFEVHSRNAVCHPSGKLAPAPPRWAPSLKFSKLLQKHSNQTLTLGRRRSILSGELAGTHFTGSVGQIVPGLNDLADAISQ